MKYDTIVIGSGQAGIPLSQCLADIGWTEALVEKRDLGGTCINTGCSPTKTMVHRAHVAHYVRNAHRWGTRVGDMKIDFPEIISQKREIVLRFRNNQQQQIDRRPNLHFHYGQAKSE